MGFPMCIVDILCGVRSHVRLDVGKAQPKLMMEDASFAEGEEQDEGETEWIQEHQAERLECSH